MSKVPFAAILLLLAVSCSDTDKNYVFALPEKNRHQLIYEGYKKAEIDMKGKRFVFDNALYKKKNDTLIRYVFNKKNLERLEIEFTLKGNDSTELINGLIRSGFVLTKKIDKAADIALIEPSSNYHYDVHIDNRHAYFVRWFMRYTSEVAPLTADTILFQ